MARGRMVSKSFSTSQRRGALVERYGAPCATCGGSLAEFAQVLYLLLVAHADDFGRQEGDTFTVQVKVDPLSKRTPAEFRRALAALDEVGLVQWFTGVMSVEPHVTRPVIAVVDFDAHQQGLHKRTSSRFPEPPGAPRNVPEIPSELKGTEQKGTKEKNAAAPLARPRRPHGRPSVRVLTAMVLRDVLPMGLAHGDAVEVAKRFAAERRLAYDGQSIERAIRSAEGRRRRTVQS